MSTIGLPAPSPPTEDHTPGWPYGTLDSDALMRGGWRPRPFRDFVLKVHQRCNLSCDYCYVYTMADQTWRDRPAVMAPRTVAAAARRIAQHAIDHNLAAARVVLHGGEPLLAGPDRLLAIADAVRSALPAGFRASFCLQTNGVLLSEPILAALLRAGITVGVSLDGGAEDHDRHRPRQGGHGSFSAVHRALSLLTNPTYRGAFAGLLCTVDLDADPVSCYEVLLGYQPPTLDFLLPHANWEQPPHRPVGRGSTPYGDWLIAAFDRWYSAPRQETRIRLFEDLISLTLGGASRSEQVGLSPVAVLVIESDGAVEQVDSLKSAYPGAAATGLNVFDHSLDEALHHPGVVARQIGVAALCETCRGCPIHRTCGAGHYVHRYRAGTGFLNPSAYCADLARLIRYVHGRVAVDLNRRLRSTHDRPS